MRYIGTIRRNGNAISITISGTKEQNNDDFLITEDFTGYAYDLKNSMLAKLFGLKKLHAMFKSMFEFIGTPRVFHIYQGVILVEKLRKQTNGLIYNTNEQEEIWRSKK